MFIIIIYLDNLAPLEDDKEVNQSQKKLLLKE